MDIGPVRQRLIAEPISSPVPAVEPWAPEPTTIDATTVESVPATRGSEPPR